jgi:hypothetical protein
MGRIRQHMFHEPGRAFARHAATIAPASRVRVLGHGETLTVGPHR